MTISAWTGPLVAFGANPQDPSNTNPEAGPSAFYASSGILDPRLPFTYKVGQDAGAPTFVLPGMNGIPLIDQVPSAAAANNIAAAQVPVAATALTLVAASGAGITAGASFVSAVTGQPVTGLAIDGVMVPFKFGSSGTMCCWDPTKAIARNVRVTSGGNDTTATFVVSGYDLYGYPMTETITGSNATIALGKKAFKYIVSVTPAGTLSGSNVSVGTDDVYGLPMRADFFAYIDIFFNNILGNVNGFLAADATNPATSITGDTRGTYNIANASGFNSSSDGTKRMQVFVTPSVANIGSATGLFGITPA